MDRHQLESEYWNSRAMMLSDKIKNELSDNWRKRRALIRLLLDYDLTGKRVLEIGCGFAFTANMLMNLFGGEFDYTGTDISDVFLDVAKRTFGINGVKARADKLPFDDNSFDVCFAFDVLEHIHPEDQEETAKELNRVLCDDAMMFINNPHPMNPCGHEEQFEHAFGYWDIAGLSESLSMEIEKVHPYTIDHGAPLTHRYHLIVMSRQSHERLSPKPHDNGLICDQFRNLLRLVNQHMPEGEARNEAVFLLDTAYNMGVKMDKKLKWYKENRP